MTGVVLWWNRPFVHVPMIDIEKDLPDRRVIKGNYNLKKSSNKNKTDTKHSADIKGDFDAYIEDHFQDMKDKDTTGVESRMKQVWDKAHINLKEKLKRDKLNTPYFKRM